MLASSMLLNKFLLIVICIISSCNSWAQSNLEVVDYPDELDHIEPLDSSRFTNDVLGQFYNGLLPLLYSEFTSNPILRYTALPSFTNSYAFSLELFEDVYYLKTNQLSENYWYSRNRSEVEVLSCSLVLDDSLAKSIKTLFATFMSEIRPVERTYSVMDGTTYFFHFTDANGELIAGETLSPTNEKLKKIIGVCNQTFGVCERNKSKREELRLELKEITELLLE